MIPRPKNKWNKNGVIRLKQFETRAPEVTEKKNSYTQTHDENCETVYNIRISTFENDSDSFVFSIKTIVDHFREGVILNDNGEIHVYLNLCSDFLTDIENMALDKQVEMSNLSEVYSLYKSFLVHRNKRGNVMILPKSSYFQKAFDSLYQEVGKKGINNSKMCVMLKDVYKKEQKCREEIYLAYMNNEENGSNDKESCSKNGDFSLKASKEKIILSRKKALIAEQGISKLEPLPRLPSPIQRRKIFLVEPLEELKFPEQVSEEQRNDELSRSEQVLSHGLSTISRDNITYGFSLTSGGSVQQTHGRPRAPPRYPNYSDYTDRLLSFSEGWQHRSPDPPRLSQVGFFFTKTVDLVRCFQCGIGLKDFSSDDDPLMEHVRHSGQCPVLLDVLGEEQLAMYKRHLQTTDPEYNRQRQWHERHNSSSARSNYRHPEYQTVQARISTFGNWPSQIMQRPEQLAGAGLYYTGVEDHVRCFACDGGLRRWDPEDDPWTEHCRWFPACPYAIEQKGEQFIALVQASVENEGYEASSGIDDLPGAMEQLKLRDSEIEHIAAQHRDVCLEMGYKEDDLKEAVKEIRERGNETPSLEDIIDLIDIIRERKKNNGSTSSILNENHVEENQRLKSFVFCMVCGKNDINALFLPCTHHKLCMTCAELVDFCPVCNRLVREKIRTYMA